MADDAAIWGVAPTQEDELFLMTNLYPKDTGLPMTVWVSARGWARHDVRVKVNTIHGPRADIDSMAVVAVRPQPRLVHGALSSRDLQAVADWITLNAQLLIDHWEGEASGVDLVLGLKKLGD